MFIALDNDGGFQRCGDVTTPSGAILAAGSFCFNNSFGGIHTAKIGLNSPAWPDQLIIGAGLFDSGRPESVQELRQSRMRSPLLMKALRRRTRCQASSSSSSSDTQLKLVSYPPNLESAAAPATAFATSSWPRSGCEMVSRPAALWDRAFW